MVFRGQNESKDSKYLIVYLQIDPYVNEQITHSVSVMFIVYFFLIQTKLLSSFPDLPPTICAWLSPSNLSGQLTLADQNTKVPHIPGYYESMGKMRLTIPKH